MCPSDVHNNTDVAETLSRSCNGKFYQQSNTSDTMIDTCELGLWLLILDFSTETLVFEVLTLASRPFVQLTSSQQDVWFSRSLKLCWNRQSNSSIHLSLSLSWRWRREVLRLLPNLTETLRGRLVEGGTPQSSLLQQPFWTLVILEQ